MNALMKSLLAPNPSWWRPRSNDPGWFRRIPGRTWAATAAVYAAALTWLLR